MIQRVKSFIPSAGSNANISTNFGMSLLQKTMKFNENQINTIQTVSVKILMEIIGTIVI